MTNSAFRPSAVNTNVEIQYEGKTYKGQYHLEHDNVVVTYQGASKMVPKSDDNDTLSRTILTEIVAAKHGRH